MDPNNTPALEPPQGVHSNLQEPSSILRGRIAACSVCLTLATATIVARLYTRKFVLKNFNVEDCTYASFSMLSSRVANAQD